MLISLFFTPPDFQDKLAKFVTGLQNKKWLATPLTKCLHNAKHKQNPNKKVWNKVLRLKGRSQVSLWHEWNLGICKDDGVRRKRLLDFCHSLRFSTHWTCFKQRWKADRPLQPWKPRKHHGNSKWITRDGGLPRFIEDCLVLSIRLERGRKVLKVSEKAPWDNSSGWELFKTHIWRV